MKKVLFVGLLVAGVVARGIFLTRTAVAEDPLPERPWFRGWGEGKGLERKAEILGMTADELKAELETKTLIEIFEEQGTAQQEL